MRRDNNSFESGATSSAEINHFIAPERLPSTDLSPEGILSVTDNLNLDDIRAYLEQYSGKELIFLAREMGFTVRNSTPKREVVDSLGQALSMRNTNRLMRGKYGF